MPDQTSPQIKVAISDPSLKKKLKIELSGPIDIIYWYIRFNIPLDETSVNERTMEVTDTDGYIMRTDITYQSKQNRIVISPIDTYEEQHFYLLNISRKVRSSKGQNLKTKIHILFKLFQKQISEYKILRQDIDVPEPKARPENYDELMQNRSPNKLDFYMTNPAPVKMQLEDVKIRVWLGVLGLVVVLIGMMAGFYVPMVIAGAIICAVGIGHIYIQLSNRNFRAKIIYNKGAKKFNKMDYQEAKEIFEKALIVNPNYDLAKYGIDKVGLYK